MKFIALSQYKSASLDDADFDLVSGIKWYAAKLRNSFYAQGSINISGKQTIILMHHYIIGQPINGMVIDHIDGNGLNNCRQNLRIISVRENAINSAKRRLGKTDSKYPGVYKRKDCDRWLAQIRIDGKVKYLGLFKDEMLAAGAYQSALRGLQ